MADPLLRYRDFKLTEAYSLERIVEVVKGEKQYRIEIFKSMSNENTQYPAHVYREEVSDTDAVTWVRVGSEEENDPDKALLTALSIIL
jgi:hypothetical protein